MFGCSAYDKDEAETDAIASIGEAGRQLTLGHESDARSWLDRAVKLNPDGLSTYVGPDTGQADGPDDDGLIACLSAHYDWPDLAAYLAKAVGNPKIGASWIVWQSLAQAQFELGQSTASQQSYQRELDILNGAGQVKGGTPPSLDPMGLSIDRADAEWGSGQQDKARADFERFIARYPQFAGQAENDLAYSDAVANVDLPNAYSLAKAAVASVRQDSDSPDELIGAYVDTLGWVEYRMHMYKEAARAAEEAISEDPDQPEIHYHLASIYQALGDLPDAKIEIDRSAALCPSDAQTHAAIQVIDPADPDAHTP
jgi:tetratricopeptide (TPR) repeat protein